MNCDTVIRVKTGVGMTKEEESGANVGQGTTEGALLSAASIDFTVNEAFKNSDKEISYGPEPLQPLLFQDDISRVSLNVESAQHGYDLLDHVLESKLLDFNVDKSRFLVVG